MNVKVAILIICPNVEGHLAEPLGIYVYQMHLTLPNDIVLAYYGEPIPKDFWGNLFDTDKVRYVKTRCEQCERGW